MPHNCNNIIDRAFFLKKTQIFSSLDLDFLLSISENMEITYHKENTPIFEYNQTGSHLYIICEGIIEIIDANKKLICELFIQDFFGDENLFHYKNRLYTAKTKTKAATLSLNKQQFQSIILECPSVAISLLELYSKNISFILR